MFLSLSLKKKKSTAMFKEDVALLFAQGTVGTEAARNSSCEISV